MGIGTRKRYMAAILVALALVTPIGVVMIGDSPSSERSHVSAYTPHGRIVILSNAELTAMAASEGWPGTGTSGNPYYIWGYEISNIAGGACVEIRNTNLYFVLGGCYLHDSQQGIMLNNVSNARLDSNLCTHNNYGIYLYNSKSNTIISNNCSYNLDNGVLLDYYSSSNAVTLNTCIGNSGGYSGGNGILISYNSYWNNVTRNNCTGNICGINLNSGSNSNIENNTAMDNVDSGIYLASSNYNSVANNSMSHNSRGITLSGSIYTMIRDNTFTGDGIVMMGGTPTNNDIGTSNRVNGLPVYFYKNREGGSVAAGGGQVILEACKNMTVENQVFDSCTVGINAVGCTNLTIAGNTCTNSYAGILLYGVTASIAPSIISNNTCNGNEYGIQLLSSRNNFVTDNVCSNNSVGIECNYARSPPGRNNVTFNSCTGNGIGIHVYYSRGETVTDNVCTGNSREGILFEYDADDATVSNNTCSNNSVGIRLFYYASGIKAENNTCEDNLYGISLDYAYGITLRNNLLAMNGVWIDSDLEAHWNTHTIDTTNLVNGKPVYYLKGMTGGLVPDGAGQVILASSTGGLVNGLSISNATVGVLLGFCSGVVVYDSQISDNIVGICVNMSDGNSLIGNALSNNSIGIQLYYSTNNAVIDNAVSEAGEGINASQCSGTVILGNAISSSVRGVSLYGSMRSSMSNNTFTGCGLWINGAWWFNTIDTSNKVNGRPIYYYSEVNWTVVPADAGQVFFVMCDNMTVQDVSFDSCTMGVAVFGCMNVSIINDDFANNVVGVFVYSAQNLAVTNNTFSLNEVGVQMEQADFGSVAGNFFDHNGIGILVDTEFYWGWGSRENEIVGNLLYASASFGIQLGYTTIANLVYNNTFDQNNGASGTYDASHAQAMDNSYYGNYWNASGRGNFWSDWTVPDGNDDGIVDEPYIIPGYIGAQDLYPLAEPTMIPEFSTTAFAGVLVLVALMVVSMSRRRRQE